MRKGLAFFILIVVIVVGLLPFGMGYLTKSSIENLYQKFSQSSPYEIKIIKYDMGWLSSTAEIQITIKDQALDKEFQQLLYKVDRNGQVKEPRFIIKEDIQHGPLVLVKSDGKIEWEIARGHVYSQVIFEPETAKVLQQYLGAIPNFHGSSLIDLTGDFHFAAEISPINVKDKSGVNFTWGGAHYNGTIYAGLNRIAMFGEIKPFNLSIGPLTASSSSLEFDSDIKLYKGSLYIYSGHVDIGLGKFQAKVADDNILLEGVNLATKQSIENGLWNGNFEIKFAKLMVNDKNYGPSNLNFAMKNLDAESYSKFQEMIQNVNDISSHEQQAQIMMKAMPLLLKTLENGAVIDLSQLNVTTPEGFVAVKANLSLPKQTQSPGNFMAGIQQLIKSAKANVDVKIPAKLLQVLVKQKTANMLMYKNKFSNSNATPMTPEEIQQQAEDMTETQITKYQQAGLLKQEGDNYEINAVYDNGQLKVNGKPFSPDMMH